MADSKQLYCITELLKCYYELEKESYNSIKICDPS